MAIKDKDQAGSGTRFLVADSTGLHSTITSPTIATASNFNAFITALGSVTKYHVYVKDLCTLTASLSVPGNITLEFLKGGSIALAGYTLTLTNSQMIAGDFQIFSGSGSVSGIKNANAMWFGATNDGSDSTAAVILAAGAGSRIVSIPYGVKFTRKTVMDSLPADTVCVDFSVINDYSSAGETSKRVGIFSRDSAPNDTHWAICGQHHVINQLNNYGGAGTQSAHERKASWIWTGGDFLSPGDATKRGFRGISILQKTKETGGNFHKLVERCLAPFASIGGIHLSWTSGEVIGGAGIYRCFDNKLYSSVGAGTCGSTAPTHSAGSVSDGGVSWTYVSALPEFESWTTGEVISSVGVFRLSSGGNFYVSATTGTCGATEPTHTDLTHATGTASDGGVSWTYVDSSDRTAWAIDEYGRIMIGSGPGTDTFRHKAGVSDLGSTYAWWGPNQAISGAGVNRRWGNRLYVSTGAGTTGATPPTHNTGTVSDGAVSWTAVNSTGTNPIGANYLMVLAARGFSKDSLLKLTPTDAAAAEASVPYLRANATDGLVANKSSDASFKIMQLHDTKGATFNEFALAHTRLTNNSSTPSVDGVGTLILANSGATTITAFSSADDNQVLHVIFENANTTIQHSSTLMLKGGMDINPGAWSEMIFQKVPASISDRWIEVDRRLVGVAGKLVDAIYSSGATPSNLPTEEVYQNGVLTTDATVTTLHTFTIPGSRTVMLEVTVVARRYSGSAGTAEDGAAYKLLATYKNVGGTATLIGAVTRAHEAESQAAWDCVLTPSSGNVLLQVTGAVNNNVAWHVTARMYRIGS